MGIDSASRVPQPGAGFRQEPRDGNTELLVPNPVATVNVSPAYLFRKVGNEDERSTVLFDEIDTVFGPKAKENEEIRGFINAGHRRGAMAGRCVVRGKTVETEEIPAFAAVALAGLHNLPDTLFIAVCKEWTELPAAKLYMVMGFVDKVGADYGKEAVKQAMLDQSAKFAGRGTFCPFIKSDILKR